MNGYDFVVVGNSKWELEIGSNIRNMLHEISAKNRVLYVNPPIDRKSAYKDRKDPRHIEKLERIRQNGTGLQKLSDNLWLFDTIKKVESINWIPSTPAFELLNKVNVSRFASEIKQAISDLDFTNIILLNDSLMFKGFGLKKLLEPLLFVYYIRDNLISQPYFKKHGATIEPKIMQEADLVVANSVFLQNLALEENSNSHYIGQGYENTYFRYDAELSCPIDLKQFKTKIIGYVGTLSSLRLDIDLIEYMSKCFQDCSIVLVGPEDQAFKESRLHQLDNVFFLGLKPMNELASYVNYFDVCINPQLINDLTIGNYPLKIDEYLSMGKPTVVTHTETMEAFLPHVYLAKDKESYVQMISKAFDENNSTLEAQRVAFASTHTWKNCISELYKNIQLSLKMRKI